LYGGRYLRIAAGDPGLFGSIAKIAGKAVPFLKAVPGLGTAISIGSAAIGVGGAIAKKIGPKAATVLPAAGAIGSIAGGAAALGVGTMAVKGARALFGGGGRRRYRRMNVTNPRALARSVRRLRGFEKMAREVMVVHNFKRFGGVKPGRRKRAA